MLTKSNPVAVETAHKQDVCAVADGKTLADCGSLNSTVIAVASLEIPKISTRTSRKQKMHN